MTATDRFTILMYHMTAAPRSERERRYACAPERFAAHMKFLRRQGYHLAGLREIDDYLGGRAPLPERSVAITFDDGFEDNYTHAFPILLEQKIPATIFLVSGAVGGVNHWMAGRGYPQRTMLNWAQIREMADAGIDFGGHTVTHPDLTQVAPAEALREMGACKREIEDRTGRRAAYFAYPYGRLTEQSMAAARAAGYALACSTRPGFNSAATPPMRLHRIEICGGDVLWRLRQKLTFGTNEAGRMLPLRYYWGRIRARLAGR